MTWVSNLVLLLTFAEVASLIAITGDLATFLKVVFGCVPHQSIAFLALYDVSESRLWLGSASKLGRRFWKSWLHQSLAFLALTWCCSCELCRRARASASHTRTGSRLLGCKQNGHLIVDFSHRDHTIQRELSVDQLDPSPWAVLLIVAPPMTGAINYFTVNMKVAFFSYFVYYFVKKSTLYTNHRQLWRYANEQAEDCGTWKINIFCYKNF
jgi:hypothetical protein